MADLIIENCRCWPSLTEGGGSDAVAVADGLIVALGAEARALPAARRIDAGGAWLLPGLIESHMHIFPGGGSLAAVDCSDIIGREALTQALRAADARDPGPHMLTGFGLKYQVLGPESPTRHDLDAILPDRPVYLTAPDFHCAWANTAALRLAGVLHGADAGIGAEVVMGADGLATGELVEFGAMTLVKRHGPTGGREDMGLRGDAPNQPPTAADRAHDRRLMRRALDWCARHGLTTATSMDGNDWQAGILAEMAAEDDLPIRASLPLTLTARQTPDDVARVLPWGPGLRDAQALGRDGDMLRFGRIKMFMDGVMDTHTALLVEPYADGSGRVGTPLFDAALFDAICTEADRLGLQIAVHAVGDGAVRAALNGFAAARAANGARDARHRIEHIELLHPDDLPRLRDLGVTASMQPPHPPGLGGWPIEPTQSLIGPARAAWAYPWRTIHDAGIPLAFSTDWPVSPVDPMASIHWALSRQPWPDAPDQRLTLDQTLAAYTHQGARAEFAETRRGRIAPGLQADLVLIAGDLAALREGPDAARPVLTVCAGRVVHEG